MSRVRHLLYLLLVFVIGSMCPPRVSATPTAKQIVQRTFNLYHNSRSIKELWNCLIPINKKMAMHMVISSLQQGAKFHIDMNVKVPGKSLDANVLNAMSSMTVISNGNVIYNYYPNSHNYGAFSLPKGAEGVSDAELVIERLGMPIFLSMKNGTYQIVSTSTLGHTPVWVIKYSLKSHPAETETYYIDRDNFELMRLILLATTPYSNKSKMIMSLSYQKIDLAVKSSEFEFNPPPGSQYTDMRGRPAFLGPGM